MSIQTPVTRIVGFIEPVKNVKEDWRGETIYQTSPLGPISICETLNDVLVLDKAANEILKLDINGTTTTYVSTGNFSFDAINYQPNRNRLIAIGENLLYGLTNDVFQLLNEYAPEIGFSTLTVASTDDSIYVGSLMNDSVIYHINATGHMLGSIVNHVQGCSQIAIHPNSTMLYYAETYSGRIIQYNLITNSSTVLTSNIGIPGTGEGIGLAVSTNGTIFYYTAEGNKLGLNKFHQGSFIPAMGTKSGTGPIFWSELHQAILCAAGAGACIVKYDLTKNQPELLTPTVNTRSIIETDEGRIFIGIEDYIYEVIGSELPKFTSQLPDSCESLLLTKQNEIFFGIMNDTLALYKLELNGTYAPWFSGGIEGSFHGMKYDRMNHGLIVSVEILSDTTNTQIWEIPIDNPMNYQLVYELENATRTSFTVDHKGNIYLLERVANILYKIPNESHVKEVLFTDFIEAAYLVQPNLGYTSIEDGIIVCRNDDLRVWPLSGEDPFILAENNVGIDNDGVTETKNQELICTHSGQIFKLIYEGVETSTTPTSTETDTTTTTTTTATSPGYLSLLVILSIGTLILSRRRK
jgi:hypothetical protein